MNPPLTRCDGDSGPYWLGILFLDHGGIAHGFLRETGTPLRRWLRAHGFASWGSWEAEFLQDVAERSYFLQLTVVADTAAEAWEQAKVLAQTARYGRRPSAFELERHPERPDPGPGFYWEESSLLRPEEFLPVRPRRREAPGRGSGRMKATPEETPKMDTTAEWTYTQADVQGWSDDDLTEEYFFLFQRTEELEATAFRWCREELIKRGRLAP